MFIFIHFIDVVQWWGSMLTFLFSSVELFLQIVVKIEQTFDAQWDRHHAAPCLLYEHFVYKKVKYSKQIR